MTWIKVKHPETNEIRSFINVVFDYSVYQHIKDCTRVIFQLEDDYDFYFQLTDEHGDKVTIKESYEVLDFIQRYPYACLRLDIVPVHKADTTIQHMMKNLELRLSSLQETVQKNNVENVVKTAAETAAHVYHTLMPNNNQQLFDVICDGCYSPIRGQRYRCETCEDFDLCSTCKSRVNHNQTHNFRLLLNDIEQQQQKKPATPVYLCDFCDSTITGLRHTCSTCPNFDLCHSCYSIVKENHPDHVFITHLVGTQAPPFDKKTSCEKDIPMPRIQHSGVTCDHCESDIKGIRYKCGHCSDFDLCEQCEAKVPSVHNPAHAFIKIRYPIQSLRKVPILPKFKPLETSPEESLPKPEEIVNKSLPIIKEPETPTVNATFLSDLNIPDGTLITPRKPFIKMWKVKNTGNVEWPIGSHLLFNGGSILRPYPISRPDCFAVPVISPDEEACITAELQAPDSPGNYTSYFCLCTPDGQRFGDNLWCTIKVDEDLEPEKRKEETELPSSQMLYPTPSTSTTPASDHQIEEEDSLSETTLDQVTTLTDSQISSVSVENEYDDYVSFADGEEEESGGASLDAHSFTSSSLPSELDDEFVFVDDESVVSTSARSISTVTHLSSQPTLNDDFIVYQSQLTQLHEMGFTEDDELAIQFLKVFDGQLDKVVAKLIEHSF